MKHAMTLFTVVAVLTLLVLPVRADDSYALPEPVFHLSFEKDLKADVRMDGGIQEVEGNWSRPAPPEYAEMGVVGRALKVQHRDGAAWLAFDTPESARASGTFLFWVRGLENLDIYGMEAGNGFRLLNSWGKGGLGWTALGFAPVLGWCELRLQGTSGAFPNFNMYKWNQLGFSWHDGRVRCYLNGDLVHEAPSAMPFERFAIGDDERPAGSLRLYDEVKLWDRLLTDAEVKRVWRRDGHIANNPLVSIPRLDTPPTINGRVDDGEWAGTAAFTGLLEAQTGEAAVDQSAFLLGYDDAFLYVAMRGDMTELARTSPASVIETFVRAAQSGRTADVTTDDAVELIVVPDYWTADTKAMGRWLDYKLNFQNLGMNANRYFRSQQVFFPNTRLGNWREYRLLANSGNAHHESVYGASGTDTEWKPAWERASSVSHLGWQFEARIPLDAFGRRPRAGETWGLHLARLWRHLKTQDDVWAWGSRRDSGLEHDTYVNREQRLTRAGMGTLRFALTGEPVVRVQTTGAVNDGRVDWRATIRNPAAEARPLKIRLFTDTDELNHSEEITVAPGSVYEFHKAHVIASYAVGGVTFLVEAPDGTLLHRTAIPFYRRQSFGARVARLPHEGRFLVDLELGALSSVPVGELRVDLDVKAADGKTIWQDHDRTVTSHSQQLAGSGQEIAPGAYTMTVTVRRGDVALGREELDFVWAGKAVWWDNRHGYEDVDNDMVPYPWTEMEVNTQQSAAGDPETKSEVVSVWGREYRFGAGLLPEQITTLGYPLLRAPMRLVVKTEDGRTFDSAAVPAAAEWTRTDRTRVEGRRRAESDGLVLENRFWAEYDGLLWSTVTLTANPPATVVSLELELPLTPQFTDVIKGVGVGKLKPEGHAGPLRAVWLGNGDGGLQWLPGPFTCRVGKESHPVRVDVAGEGATLHVTVIGTPTLLEQPLNLPFGLQATPVRPNVTRTAFFTPHSVRGGGSFYPPGIEALPAADAGYDYYGGSSKTGRLYVWTAQASTAVDALGRDDFGLYGSEWMADPFQLPVTGWNTKVITPTASKSYVDYFVWRHWQYQRKYGFGGLYYDNPNFDRMANREIMKRLYNITLRNHHQAARDAAIGLASNGNYDMGFGGFVNYQWNGEHLNSAIHARQPTYRGLIGPAVFRAEYMGHNWGWPSFFLGQGRLRPEWVEANGGPEAVIDQFQGLELLHDCRPSGWHFPGAMDQVCKRAQYACAKHDLSHWIYQFTPYWHQDIVALPDGNMHASWYIARPSVLAATNPRDEMGYPWGNRVTTFFKYFEPRMPEFDYLPPYIRSRNFNDTEAARKEFETMEDRAVLIVYNDSDWEGEMRLKVDWQKLGLGAPETLKANNAVHSTGFRLEKAKNDKGEEIEKAVFFARPEEFARIENGELVFPMTKYNYRMIVIEQAE